MSQVKYVTVGNVDTVYKFALMEVSFLIRNLMVCVRVKSLEVCGV